MPLWREMLMGVCEGRQGHGWNLYPFISTLEQDSKSPHSWLLRSMAHRSNWTKVRKAKWACTGPAADHLSIAKASSTRNRSTNYLSGFLLLPKAQVLKSSWSQGITMCRTFRGWSLVGGSSVPSYRILGPSLFPSFVPKPLWNKQGPPAVCSYMTYCATTGPSDHRRKIPNLRVKANPSSLRLIGGYFVSEKNYNTYFFLINSSTNFGSYTKQQTVNFKISPEACLVHDLSSTIIFSQQCFYAFPTAEGK